MDELRPSSLISSVRREPEAANGRAGRPHDGRNGGDEMARRQERSLRFPSVSRSGRRRAPPGPEGPERE